MENDKFDRIRVMQTMQQLKEEEVAKMQQQTSLGEVQFEEGKVTVKYLGKIFLVSEFGEKIESEWYAVIVQKDDGTFEINYYDKDKELIGKQLPGNEEIYPVRKYAFNKPEEMKAEERGENSDKKTLEELQKEQTEQQEKISSDLAENTGDPSLKIKTYRRIIDSRFAKEFPGTFQGAKEIGISYLEDGRYAMVADYGNGYEIAKGTELAMPTSQQVYNEDATKDSPDAVIRITADGSQEKIKEIGIEIDQYGYITTTVIDRKPGEIGIANKVALEGKGDGTDEGISAKDAYQDAFLGENAGDVKKILTQFANNDISHSLIDSLVDKCLNSCSEQLDELYKADEQRAAVERAIKKQVKDGVYDLENIKLKVKKEIEFDRDLFTHGRDPRRG